MVVSGVLLSACVDELVWRGSTLQVMLMMIFLNEIKVGVESLETTFIEKRSIFLPRDTF